MSTPLEQFDRLTLDSEDEAMALSSATIMERAADVQDLLSALSKEELLPSEIAMPIVEGIARPPQSRPKKSEWTIPADLEGTLMYWGCYDDQTYQVLTKFMSPTQRFVEFRQKLARRFTRCFDEYDELRDSGVSIARIKEQIAGIVDGLDDLCAAVHYDLQSRGREEKATLGVLLKALKDVCQRTDPMVGEEPRRSSRRPSSSAVTGPNLFDALVRGSARDSRNLPFMLPLLEEFSSAAQLYHLDKLVDINGLLNKKGAPADYIARFERLQVSAREEDQPAASSTSGRDRRLPADQRSGSKRTPEPEPEPVTKRGRRRG